MATRLDFAKALLNKLGLPQTQNRLISLVAFAAIEGGEWAPNLRGTHNPLNTTLSVPGSRRLPGFTAAIQGYPDWQTGISATASTMKQSNMKPIMDALIADADPRAFLQGVTNSKWCPGCDYTQIDPQALYNAHANEPDPSDSSSIDSGSTAGAMGWVKDHPYLTAAGILLLVGGATYFLRPDLFRKIPVVGPALLARENPVDGPPRRRRRRRRMAAQQNPVVQRPMLPPPTPPPPALPR